MTIEEVRELKIDTEVNFKRDGLICGTAFYTGIVLRPSSIINPFTEIKYTGRNSGYCNVKCEDIISVTTK